MINNLSIDENLILRVEEVIEQNEFLKISKYFNSLKLNTDHYFDAIKNSKLEVTILNPFVDAIKKIMLTNLNIRIQLSGFTTTKRKNLPNMHWHKHRKTYQLDSEPFNTVHNYICVWYLHEFWEEALGGNLIVGKEESNPYVSIPAIPNSCVIHSASLYHGVTPYTIKKNDKVRTIMYSHWKTINE